MKFVYGPLIHDRVGTICHEDAYSQGTTEVEIENTNYIRRLYTVQSLLANTNKYNEIVYVVEDVPFLPIGILCEDEITNEEQEVAKKLDIPLLYRKSREFTYKGSSKVYPKKIYKFTPEKVLF